MSSQFYYTRNKNCPKPPPPKPPPCPPPPPPKKPPTPPPPPPKKKKIKFDFCKMKKNTICSLNEVECFLNNFNKFCDYITLYKILK